MHIDYDAYANLSPLRKVNVLDQLNDENIAELVTTHWKRFLEANRARMSEEQVRVLEKSRIRIELHFGAFKNSGEIRNPIARILAITRPKAIDEELRAALCDVATLPPAELRSRRPDLPELPGRFYDGMPEDFWSFASDEDVPLAASRAYAITGPRRKAAAPPPPAPPC